MLITLTCNLNSDTDNNEDYNVDIIPLHQQRTNTDIIQKYGLLSKHLLQA